MEYPMAIVGNPTEYQGEKKSKFLMCNPGGIVGGKNHL